MNIRLQRKPLIRVEAQKMRGQNVLASDVEETHICNLDFLGGNKIELSRR